MSAFFGQASGWAPRLDPVEELDLSIRGSDTQGDGWWVAVHEDHTFVGMPDVSTVRSFANDSLVIGTSPFDDEASIEDSQNPDSAFGASLMAVSDNDGNGTPDMVVGSPLALGLPEAPQAGRVYLFNAIPTQATGSLSSTDALLTIIGSDAYDRLGKNMQPCGDIDGDGLSDWVLWAPWSQGSTSAEASTAPPGGSLWVIITSRLSEYLDSPGVEVPVHQLGNAYYSSFVGADAGTALLCDKDFNGDGWPELMVGAPYADHGGVEASGAVYILDLREGTDSNDMEGLADQITRGGDLEETATWVTPPAEPESYLGSALAAGDITGSGTMELLVGAPGADDGRGATVLFHNNTGGSGELTEIARFTGEDTGDHFGKTLLVADLNGDSNADMAIGAPHHNPMGEMEYFASGALYIWYGSLGYPTLEAEHEASRADTTFERSQAYLLVGDWAESADINQDGINDIIMLHRTEI